MVAHLNNVRMALDNMHFLTTKNRQTALVANLLTEIDFEAQ